MNIKILDSWLREFVDTRAKPIDLAEKLSLTSVSIEKIEEVGKDFNYDIEVTTNRPDLMSVTGIAKETAAVLPEFGIMARYKPLRLKKPTPAVKKVPIKITSDPKLVNRILAVVMEVDLKSSPTLIKNRLEATDIRSLNNVVDVTNYVMRTVGHPAHVFDYDRIVGQTLVIRLSKKGETIVTLDGKTHVLSGGDIVAQDGSGKIVDLLGIMGLENSVVTNNTKRILYFLDNNNPHLIRKTSMEQEIRTDAAQLNEKGLDPELMYDAFIYGIELFEENADGKIISDIIDIYPNKIAEHTVSVSLDKLQSVIGIPIPLKTAKDILTRLEFRVTNTESTLTVTVPTIRAQEVSIEEDIIEEIARVYGYHKIPSLLPPLGDTTHASPLVNEFYFENKLKRALQYWGFIETYTYSFVSEDMYEGPNETAVRVQNPLTSDWIYMRRTLIPSLLKVVEENKTHPTLRIFELANTYEKKDNSLPDETRHLAIVMKKENLSFFDMKGVIEQLTADLGIAKLSFQPLSQGGGETQLYIGKDLLGHIEILDTNLINAELSFPVLLKHATTHKVYTPMSKFPPVIEDISLILDDEVKTGDVIDEILNQNSLIKSVSLLDKYQNTKTFHIIYQHKEKNLTDQDVAEIRIHVVDAVKKKFNAKVK